MKTRLLSPAQAVRKLKFAGLNQAEIASLLGVSQGTISKIQTGRIKANYAVVDGLRALAASIKEKKSQ